MIYNFYSSESRTTHELFIIFRHLKVNIKHSNILSKMKNSKERRKKARVTSRETLFIINMNRHKIFINGNT